MQGKNDEMFDFLSEYVTKSDVYAADAIAKISMQLFKARKNLNMTQKAFAAMMGVSQGMVSKWESANYNFTIENIAQIAEKLNMTFEIKVHPESEYIENYRRERRTEFTHSNQYRTLSKIEFEAA